MWDLSFLFYIFKNFYALSKTSTHEVRALERYTSTGFKIERLFLRRNLIILVCFICVARQIKVLSRNVLQFGDWQNEETIWLGSIILTVLYLEDVCRVPASLKQEGCLASSRPSNPCKANCIQKSFSRRQYYLSAEASTMWICIRPVWKGHWGPQEIVRLIVGPCTWEQQSTPPDTPWSVLSSSNMYTLFTQSHMCRYSLLPTYRFWTDGHHRGTVYMYVLKNSLLLLCAFWHVQEFLLFLQNFVIPSMDFIVSSFYQV